MQLREGVPSGKSFFDVRVKAPVLALLFFAFVGAASAEAPSLTFLWNPGEAFADNNSLVAQGIPNIILTNERDSWHWCVKAPEFVGCTKTNPFLQRTPFDGVADTAGENFPYVRNILFYNAGGALSNTPLAGMDTGRVTLIYKVLNRFQVYGAAGGLIPNTDPLFVEAHGKPMFDNDDYSIGPAGAKIHTGPTPVNVTEFFFLEGVRNGNPTNCAVYDANLNVMTAGQHADIGQNIGYVTFSPEANLSADSAYYLACDAQGGAPFGATFAANDAMQNPITFPVTGTYLNWTDGLLSGSDYGSPGFIISVINATLHVPAPSVSLQSPLNDDQERFSNSLNFSCNASGALLNQVELWGNWSGGWKMNQTANVTPAFSHNHTFSAFVEDGFFAWNCRYLSDVPGIDALAPANYSLGIENQSRWKIEWGIHGPTLMHFAPIFPDQQIQVVQATGFQNSGRFDKVSSRNNQTWAFNYRTPPENFSSIPSLSNLVNVWENQSLPLQTIYNQVVDFIQATLH